MFISYRRPKEEDVWVYTCSWWWNEVHWHWNMAAEQNFASDSIHVQSRWVQNCPSFDFCLPSAFQIIRYNSYPECTAFNPSNCTGKYCVVSLWHVIWITLNFQTQSFVYKLFVHIFTLTILHSYLQCCCQNMAFLCIEYTFL